MDDVDIELVLEVHQLGALEHATRINLGTRRPRLNRTVGHLATERLTRGRIRHQISRAGVERILEAPLGLAAGLEDRGVITSKQHFAIGGVADRLPDIEQLEELLLELPRVGRAGHQVPKRQHACRGLLMRANFLGGALVLKGEPLLARGLLEPSDTFVGGALQIEGLARVGGRHIRHWVARSEFNEGRALGYPGFRRDLLVGAASCQNDRRHCGDSGSAKHAAKKRAIHHDWDCIGKILDLSAETQPPPLISRGGKSIFDHKRNRGYTRFRR